MYKIMIPYRDREEHLKIFVERAIPFFEENRRPYKIIIVEQTDDKPFNLGKLTNVGFDIYKKEGGYSSEDSFIFQPVDCIPYDAHYDAPRRGIAKLASHYGTPRISDPQPQPQGEPRVHGVPYYYKAFSIDPVAYEQVNGFTNECWGWGAEDDEFFVRLEIKDINTVHRLCLYEMLGHELASLEYHTQNMSMAHQLRENKDIFISGLNTLEYSIKEKTERHGLETYVCEI